MSDVAQGVGHMLIQRGCSMQNDHIESFNDKLRDKYSPHFFARSPACVVRLRSGVMARVILGKQKGAGRGDVRVAKVLANELGVHLVALMGSRRVTHPMSRCLLDLCSGRS